jgi:hypothetical protein
MLSLVTAITVIAGLIMGIVVMCERKKKDEEELERYLDGVIQ